MKQPTVVDTSKGEQAPNDAHVSVEQAAAWFKALGHPARLAILHTLAARQTCVCGEIVEELPLAQSTVSQHLKVLREVGFVQGFSDGPRSCYCLDGDTLRRARAGIERLLSTLEGACGCGC